MLLIVFSVVGVAIIFGTVMLSLWNNPAPFTSDEDLVTKTLELEEVQAFYAKYPNATSHVQRLGSDIAVTHAIRKSVADGHPIDRSNVTAARGDSVLWIDVFMGSKSLRVQQISLFCSGGDVIYDQNSTGWRREHNFQLNSGIVSYLQEGKELECFT